MRDRGHFQKFDFLAILHHKNSAIIIRIYTTVYVQILSPFGPDSVEIFEVAERWVMVDVWVGVSIVITEFFYIFIFTSGQPFGLYNI